MYAVCSWLMRRTKWLEAFCRTSWSCVCSTSYKRTRRTLRKRLSHLTPPYGSTGSSLCESGVWSIGSFHSRVLVSRNAAATEYASIRPASAMEVDHSRNVSMHCLSKRRNHVLYGVQIPPRVGTLFGDILWHTQIYRRSTYSTQSRLFVRWQQQATSGYHYSINSVLHIQITLSANLEWRQYIATGSRMCLQDMLQSFLLYSLLFIS